MEVGGLILSVGTGRVWSYPLVPALTFIVARNYRAYAIAAQQAQTLLAQSEQLRAQQRPVAVLDERSRLARETHDVLAHSPGAPRLPLHVIRAVPGQGLEDQSRPMRLQAQRMASERPLCPRPPSAFSAGSSASRRGCGRRSRVARSLA